VLTGVDVGAYRDETSGADLADVVAALSALPGLRLRLSSLEPGHLTPRLLGALAHERVARHLHLPLQSADDRVLAAMARPYSFTDYRDAIARARVALGDVAVTTDVIVGFPAEDEAAFARTLAAIGGGGVSAGVGGEDGSSAGGPFERVHVFSYSRRPGTPAETLGELTSVVVKERMGRALDVARDVQRAAHLRRLGRPAEVLLEERRDGLWRGYGSHYVRYYLEGEGARGDLVRAVGDEAFADGLRGRIL
jgi:threonylcarbamoyladenosine tRNA methylthiotransferase MtaB